MGPYGREVQGLGEVNLCRRKSVYNPVRSTCEYMSIRIVGRTDRCLYVLRRIYKFLFGRYIWAISLIYLYLYIWVSVQCVRTIMFVSLNVS